MAEFVMGLDELGLLILVALDWDALEKVEFEAMYMLKWDKSTLMKGVLMWKIGLWTSKSQLTVVGLESRAAEERYSMSILEQLSWQNLRCADLIDSHLV